MRERPILFSGPMVRAILAGNKTQTRRVAKPVRHPDLGNVYTPGALVLEREPQHVIDRACPYGQPGDRLWVRETWNRFEPWAGFYYAADYEAFGIGPDDDPDHIPDHEVRWKPSIHMPRAACRLVLEITGVRVERLQDISEADARAEGCPFTWDGKQYEPPPPEVDSWQGYGRASFSLLWSQINGPDSWQANPWVWVVEFRRAEDRGAHA
ncbi:hypothetical protein [Achromobacter xylosoxidans]|uniref:hypothetical protein n=1 Tax=Alcaligenes xylosoxydans xylosoxydans TaxID=85698 RepID=UPI003BA582B0